MTSPAQIELILQEYLDRVEDTRLNAILRLSSAITQIDSQFWLSLTRTEVTRQLAQRLAVGLASGYFPEVDDLALFYARNLSGMGSSEFERSLNQVEAVGVSRILPGSVQAEAVNQLALGIHRQLLGSEQAIRTIIGNAPPKSESEAKIIIGRIRSEIVGRLVSHDELNAAIQGPHGMIVNQAGAVAQIRLQRPKLSPEQAAAATRAARFLWAAALKKTCPDCLPRHGQIDSWERWAVRGLPRSGWSVCRDKCQCVLIPQREDPGYAKMVQPLRREAMSLIEDGTPRGLTVRVPRELLAKESQQLVSQAQRTDEIRKAYDGDIRVRRAMRMIGEINANVQNLRGQP
jgi:hypothetical protein